MPTYIKMGRGGAGNMISSEELQQKATDIEAQKSAALANEVAQEQESQQEVSEYKHMGRGGAGNWYTPATLATGGTFTDTTTPAPDDDSASAMTTATNPDPTSLTYAHQHVDPRPWRGRGGAGNYVYDKPLEPERIELQERQIAQELEEEVRRDVEEGLKKPDSAYLGKNRGSYSTE